MKINLKIKENIYKKESVQYYLNQIPDEEYRKKALKNYNPRFSSNISNSVSSALSNAFNWKNSREGDSYWRDYHTKLIFGKK